MIYLLRNLRFVINLNESVLQPKQSTEFLGMIIDWVEMKVSLPQEKVESISKRCQDMLLMQDKSITDFTKLLGTLSSTALAILPAPLYMRYRETFVWTEIRTVPDLDPLRKEEPNWWISNPNLSNRKLIFFHQVERLIRSDTWNTSKYRSVGFFSEDISREETFSRRTGAVHKYTRTDGRKFAILTFCRYKKALAVHVKMDNQAASSINLFSKSGERGRGEWWQETHLWSRRKKKHENFV